ncbi:MAG: hypothetical protein U0V73_00600 [Acidimicrobiia bacterium]
MAAVVNHLHFREPFDPELFADAERSVVPRMHEVPGFEALHVVQTSDRDVILVILADTVETLDRLATEVGSPWMREHVVPLLAGPPERHIGPVIATSGR